MKNAKIEYLQNKVIEIHNNLHRNCGKLEGAYFYKELDSDIQDDILNRKLEILDYDDIEREVATSMEEHINKLENKFVKDVLLTCLESDMIEREGSQITPYLKSEISLDDLSLEYINNLVKLEYGDGFEKLVDYMTGNTTLCVNIPTISIDWNYNRLLVDCDASGWDESMEWYIISSVVSDIQHILEDFKDGDLMQEINRLFETWTSEDAIHDNLYNDTWTLYNEDGDYIED